MSVDGRVCVGVSGRLPMVELSTEEVNNCGLPQYHSVLSIITPLIFYKSVRDSLLFVYGSELFRVGSRHVHGNFVVTVMSRYLS